MPSIQNSSVVNQAKRVCKVLKARGENLNAEVAATILVRALLEELGETELLNSTDKLDIEQRTALVAMAKPFMTASKNLQNTWFCKTNGDDGTPLLPEVKGTDDKGLKAEFA